MKIVFLTSNINEPRVTNRIAEFHERGYELEVFCYCRDPERPFRKEEGIEYHMLGDVGRGASSYLKRVSAEFADVRKIIKGFNGRDVVFYLINNDMALLYYLIRGKHPYVYEEADLRHTYFGSDILMRLFEYLDKRIISKSLLTVFLSKGFARFHYGEKPVPENVTFIFNKLNPRIVDYPYSKIRVPDPNHLRIGFVGSIRFESVFNFVKVVCRSFPQHEVHFYGLPVSESKDSFEKILIYDNCVYHGPFSNPSDLPAIYSEIDIVLSTYDTRYDNVRFAEPNKIYESVFFEVPIIVSNGTYLAERVSSMDIGYSVDAMDDAEVISLINRLTGEDLLQKSANAHLVPKNECIMDNDDFFSIFEARRIIMGLQ